MGGTAAPVTPEPKPEGQPPGQPTVPAEPDFDAADKYVEEARAKRAAEKKGEEPPTVDGSQPAVEGETTPPAKAADGTEAPPVKKKVTHKDWQARLDTEVKKTNQERERAERLEKELADARAAKPATEPVRQPAAPAPTTTPNAEDPEPDEADIGTKYARWEDYNKEHTKWAARDAVREDRRKQDEQATKERRDKAQADASARAKAEQDYFAERAVIATADIEAFKKTHADFDAVVANPEVAFTPYMDQAIAELDSGMAAVFYHLGSHPAESKRIAGLRPIKQVSEIHKLADRLAAASPAPTTDDEVEDDGDSGSAPVRGSVHRPSMEPVKPVGSRSLSAASPLSEVTNADEYVSRRRRERNASRARRGLRG